MMRGSRTILILAALTAVVGGAALFMDREPSAIARGGELVFPALLDQVNSVARVRVTGSEGAFTLGRNSGRWVVEEKEGHPADPDKMHTLILGAAGMKRVEPKTSNPGLYSRIWLEDPTGKDAKSARFVFEDAAGAELADWVLGNRRPSKSDPARTEFYIRVGEDPQAWLVEGSMPSARTTIDWVDRLVARIKRGRLRGVEITHADDSITAVSKSLPTDRDFVLQGAIPEGREIDAQYRINDIGHFLEEIRFEDVMPISALDFSAAVDKRVQITTFDGLRVHLSTILRDGDAWAALRAEVDEGLVEAGAEPQAGAQSGDTGPLRPIEEVRAQAEELNARWARWAYELPSFKRDYIAKGIDELTRPIEQTDGEKASDDSCRLPSPKAASSKRTGKRQAPTPERRSPPPPSPPPPSPPPGTGPCSPCASRELSAPPGARRMYTARTGSPCAQPSRVHWI